ncbi:hypothetical protein AGR13a_Lc90375 [Agrobacterium genomosp. 13 str. CFBP 6927]|uniref:Uncharacterized protein n=1 Tax=Agrobacterium genomosp. 13 str. CFBP 6927 TaxID=1183428 RepID=A0ABP2BQ39_9HYPH|nr:hypothetical protein AGR13a_Lc90375 [Agrobacterium genomosp. 13 str. CFBP 6927]
MDTDIYANHCQKPEREWPCKPIATTAPETSRADPEALQQISPTSLFGLFRRQAQSSFHLLWREGIIGVLSILRGCGFGTILVGTIDRFRSCVSVGHGRLTDDRLKGFTPL